jgi:hypothetical protein
MKQIAPTAEMPASSRIRILFTSRPWKWRWKILSRCKLIFQLIARRYIRVDRNLHNHRCENLKSYNIYNWSLQGIDIEKRCGHWH